MSSILAAIFIGWNLGSNDAGNVFGTFVGKKIINFNTAAIVASVFVILGAVLSGEEGVRTYNSIIGQTDLLSSVIVAFSGGISVFFMTKQNIPVSTTHCILAGLLALGIHNKNINFEPLGKVFASWFISPISACILSFCLYYLVKKGLKGKINNIIIYDKFVKISAIIIGAYGSYSLGANNIANVVGVFAGVTDFPVKFWLLLGGISISVGIITYSKKVMNTIGNKIANIDNFGAIISVLAVAIVSSFYASIGVPVSNSQGIVGAVIGVGIFAGRENIDMKIIIKIVKGWVYSILVAGALTLGLLKIVAVF